MTKLQGIYKIENKLDGKVYIGQAIDIYGRWDVHEEELNMGVHGNIHLQRAWNKYIGWENFEFSILELVRDKHDLTNCEEYWMDFVYDSRRDRKKGYNIRHALETKPLSEESRWRMSLKAKERFKDPTNNPMYGKKHTKETIENIKQKNRENHRGEKNAFYGRKHSKKTKKSISDKKKGQKLSEEAKKKVSEAGKGKIPYNKVNIPSETTNLIIEKLNQGCALASISREFDISYKILIRIRKELFKEEKVTSDAFGCKSANKIHFSEKERNNILERLNNKEKLTSISKDYDCTYHVIRRIKNELIQEGKLNV